MSEQMDDSDLEVSPVASVPPTPPSAPVGSETVVSFTSATQTPSPSPSRHVSVMAPRPHTQQLLRAASVAGLLTLLIAAGLLVPSANREALVRFITPPTPSPTLAPERGYDAFLWEHSVPWGQLLIDSQPGPNVRGSAVRQNAQGVWEGAAFHLPRGHHTLEYRAAPFPPLVCVLSVPSSRADTCPLDHSFDYSNLAPRAPATRLLDLQATMRHLPTTQADALVAAAQAQLNALAARLGRSMLSGGDHFLDVTGDVVQVSTTVYVEPRFALDTSITDYDGLPCMTLCTIHDLVPEAASPEEWTILAPVMPTWRYTAPRHPATRRNASCSIPR